MEAQYLESRKRDPAVEEPYRLSGTPGYGFFFSSLNVWMGNDLASRKLPGGYTSAWKTCWIGHVDPVDGQTEGHGPSISKRSSDLRRPTVRRKVVSE